MIKFSFSYPFSAVRGLNPMLSTHRDRKFEKVEAVKIKELPLQHKQVVLIKSGAFGLASASYSSHRASPVSSNASTSATSTLITL